MVSTSIAPQWHRGGTVLLNALARLAIPQVNALWRSGNDSAIMQLQDVQDAIITEPVRRINRRKHELLCPTHDGAQQHDEI
jgi:hypothetical protein